MKRAGMEDVASILQRVAGGPEELAKLLTELQETESAERSGQLLTFIVRIRKAAGLPPVPGRPDGPKELLELIERLEAETERETENGAPQTYDDIED